MSEMGDFIYGVGCTPSVLDGTEYEYNVDDKLELPSSFSWREFMPDVKDQGSTSQCVCYTLTGMLDFLTNSDNDTPNVCNNYDINHLYSIRANKMAEGMSIKEALSYLKKVGLNGKKINGYAKIYSVIAAQQALISQGPLAIGTLCYNNNMNEYWIKRGMNMGGHCVMLVGYDNERQAFILRNSWGKSWADGGYIYFPYDDFVNYVFECWTFLL